MTTKEKIADRKAKIQACDAGTPDMAFTLFLTGRGLRL